MHSRKITSRRAVRLSLARLMLQRKNVHPSKMNSDRSELERSQSLKVQASYSPLVSGFSLRSAPVNVCEAVKIGSDLMC